MNKENMQSWDSHNNLLEKQEVMRAETGGDMSVMFMVKLSSGNSSFWYTRGFVEVRTGAGGYLQQIHRWRLEDGKIQWLDDRGGQMGACTWNDAHEDVQAKYSAWLAKEMLK